MIVLDTNVVSELMKPAPSPTVAAWLIRQAHTPLVTTAVTVSEIVFGLQRLPEGRRKEGLLSRFNEFVSAGHGLLVLPLDEAAAREAGWLRCIREKVGLSCQASDMLIAGIASVAGGVLATRNVMDFSKLPLEVVDPWSGSTP